MMRFLIFVLILFGYGISGEISRYLDSLTVSISSGRSVEVQERGYYIGGGVSYTSPSATFQPFTVVPPEIKAGCGSIDLTSGSFSYFKVDNLIEFAQKLITDAPAFAFDIALDIMCPQCSSTMKKLTALANQINAMSLNSCEIMANLSNRIKAEVINYGVKEGKSTNWLDRVQWIDAVNNTLDDWTNMIGEWNNYLSKIGCSNPDCYLFAGYNSVADRFISEISSAYPYWNTTEMRRFVRALFGDLIKKDGTPPTYRCVMPVAGIEKVIDNLAQGEGVIYLPGYDENGNFVPVKFTGTAKDYVKKNIDSIVNKILNRRPLSSSDMEFLARYDIPALGLLRVFAPSPSALLAIKEDLEEYLAYELAYRFVAGLHVEFAKLTAKINNMMKESPSMKEEDIKCLEEVISMKRATESLRAIREHTEKAKGRIVRKIRFALDLYEMQKFVYSKFSRHPLMASYTFGNALK